MGIALPRDFLGLSDDQINTAKDKYADKAEEIETEEVDREFEAKYNSTGAQ